MVLDWAVYRYGNYVDWRVEEYARRLNEQAQDGDRAKEAYHSRGKRAARSSGSVAEQRKRARIRDDIERFSEAIRTGLTMDEVRESRPRKTRNLRELIGATR